MSLLQIPLPWSWRVLAHRPLTVAEELLEVLACEGEPIVAEWARGLRGRVRETEALAAEVARVEAQGGPVARSLAFSVRHAWQEFAGAPLPLLAPSSGQPRLPFA